MVCVTLLNTCSMDLLEARQYGKPHVLAVACEDCCIC